MVTAKDTGDGGPLDDHGERSAQARLKPLRAGGFVDGLWSVFGGFAFLIKTPATWRFAVVPIGVFFVLVSLLVWMALRYAAPWVEAVLPSPDAAWARYGVRALAWIGGALAALASVFIALALTPPLSGPALERIVALREFDLGVASAPSLGFFSEVACGLRAQFAAALVGLPILAVIWALVLLFPPAALVALPLKYAVIAWMAAWNLLDYPLTLRGVPIRRRLALLRRDWRSALGFGTAFSLLFAVPCFGILLLPAAAAGAGQLAVSLGWLSAADDPPNADHTP